MPNSAPQIDDAAKALSDLCATAGPLAIAEALTKAGIDSFLQGHNAVDELITRLEAVLHLFEWEESASPEERAYDNARASIDKWRGVFPALPATA